MTPTLGAFLSARRSLAGQEHPHRLWEGEECGIQRTWQLEEIPNRELAEFCIHCWEKIAQVVVDAHVWRGAKFQPEAGCKRSLADYRTIRESEVFIEVEKAWDSEPSETVRCQGNELKFFAEPRNNSEVLHTITKGQEATGWVGGNSPLRGRNFVSMLIYSLHGETITNNTCVFFRHADAVIESDHTN